MIWVRRILLAVIALMALLIGAVALVVGTTSGSRWLVAQGLEAAGGTVQVAEVEGTLLDRLTVRGLRLADASGVWLTAGEVTLDWQPLRLLGGRLWVDLLAAREVDVLRPPEGGEQDPAAEGQPFDLTQLERLVVQELDLADIALAEPVLGAPMAFSAAGHVTGTERGGVDVHLEARRLDAPGEALLDISHRPGDVLGVHLAAYEPPGGVVARLLDLPGLPAVRATLDGEGPADDWNGALLAEAADFVTIEADLALALAGEGERAVVEGTARPGPLMPAEIRAATGEALAFAATLRRGPQGVMAAEEIAFRGQGWTLEGAGRLDPESGVEDARAVLDIADGAPLEAVTGVPVGRGNVELTAEGPLDALGVAVAATLDDTLVRQARLQGRARLGGETIPFEAEGHIAGVAELVPQAAALVGEGLDFAVVGEAAPAEQSITFDRLTMQTSAMGAEYVGTVFLDPLAVSGGLEAAITDLAALEPLVGVPLRGVATLGADLDANQDLIGGDLRLILRDFATGIPQADALLAGRVDAATSVRWEGEVIGLRDLTLEAPGAALRGAVALDGFENVDGTFVLLASELGRLDLPVTGGVEAEGRITGTLAAPELVANVTGRDIVASGLEVTRPTATVRVTGQRLAVEDLRAGVAGVRVAGGLALPYDSGLIDGRFDLRMESPERFAALTGQPVTGSLSGQLTMGPVNGGQGLSARLTGEALALPDAGVAVRTLSLRAELTDLFAAPSGRVEADLGEGGAGGLTWEAGTLSARLDDGGGTFSASLRGDQADPYEARVGGRLDMGEATAVRLDTLSVAGRGHQVSLAAPTTLTIAAGGGLRLARTRLAVDGGTLSLQAALADNRIDLDVQGRIPLDIVEIALPAYAADGTLDLEARLQGPLSGPTGRINLRTSELTLPEANVQGLVVEARADIARNRLTARASFLGIAPEPGVITADVPLEFSPSGVPSIPPTRELSVAADWRGPVQAIWALVPQVGHRLAGQAVVEARLGGTLDAPVFSGEAALRGGSYENLDWGTVLRDLTVTAALRPDGDISLDGSASDGGNGRLNIGGTIDNGPAGPSQVQARITLNGVQVARRDDLRAGLSGEVTYAGTLDEGTVRGDLRTETVRLSLGAQLGGGVAELDVVEVNRAALGQPEELPGAAGAGTAEGPAFGSAIALEVRVSMPNRVYVTGQGLDSEWQGELTVRGTAAQPSIVGALNVVRGTFSAIGRTFVLESGTVEFTGGTKINPTITVRAVHEAQTITAIVLISGTPGDLEFGLDSRPSLPEDEIIARVLFGRGVGELGAAEGIAVAQTAARLAGVGGDGPGVLESLRGAFNLDVLNVGGGEGGPTVEAGRYIGDNVYVGVESGAGADSGSVEVEVELAPGVTLETRGSAKRGADIGVEWKFDY